MFSDVKLPGAFARGGGYKSVTGETVKGMSEGAGSVGRGVGQALRALRILRRIFR